MRVFLCQEDDSKHRGLVQKFNHLKDDVDGDEDDASI